MVRIGNLRKLRSAAQAILVALDRNNRNLPDPEHSFDPDPETSVETKAAYRAEIDAERDQRLQEIEEFARV